VIRCPAVSLMVLVAVVAGEAGAREPDGAPTTPGSTSLPVVTVAPLRLECPVPSPPPLEVDLDLEPPEVVLEVILRNPAELKRAEERNDPLLFAYGVALAGAGAEADAREVLGNYAKGGGLLAPWAALVLGNLDLDAGRLRGAERHFLRAARVFSGRPAEGRARLGLARVARARGKLVEARSMLESLVQGASSQDLRRASVLELAGVQVAQGACREGVDLLEDLWSTYPLSKQGKEAGRRLEVLAGDASCRYAGPGLEVQVARALRLQRQGQAAEGLAALQALAGEPGTGDEVVRRFCLELAMAHFRARAYGEALPLFERCAARRSGSARLEVRYWVGLTRSRLGDFEGAIEVYDELARTAPGTAVGRRALLKIGLLRLDQGRYDAAEEAFERLVALQPPPALLRDALWFLAWTELRQGAFDEARSHYGAFVRRFPTSSLVSGAWYWQGRMALEQGREDEAGKLFRAAAEPRQPTHYAAFARVLLEQLGVTMAESASGEPRPAVGSKDRTRPAEVARAHALADVGLWTWAREEMAGVAAAARGRGAVLQVAGWYRDIGDYRGAARLAARVTHRSPVPEIHDPAPDWRLSYPRAFQERMDDLDLPPQVSLELLLAIMRQESRFDTRAVSIAGARGPMQLMPATAVEVAEAHGITPPSPADLHDPGVALQLASWLLQAHLDRFDSSLPLAVAAYNAGEEAVARWLKERPGQPIDVFMEEISYAETRRYVRKVLANLWIYSRLYGRGVDDFASALGLATRGSLVRQRAVPGGGSEEQEGDR